jgi:hypothetical protein
MKRWRRHLVRVMLLLLAGAVVNVAVAWGCAYRAEINLDKGPIRSGASGPHDDGSRNAGYEDWIVSYVWRRGGLSVQSEWRDRDTSDDIEAATLIEPESLIPSSWAQYLVPSQSSQTTRMEHIRCVDAWGWPVLSLYTVWTGDDRYGILPAQRATYGIHLQTVSRHDPMMGIYWAERAFPLMPMWPGFAINTVFYAGILAGGWMLFAAPGMIRRRGRIKRGLCPACAYPVGTSSVCTECGLSVVNQQWIAP